MASLYANIDTNRLNWAEHQWMNFYIYIGNPIIATGLISFLVHEIVYFGRCVPWIIVDAIPYFQRWKLQPKKVPTKQQQWECTKQVLFSHFVVELPAVRRVDHLFIMSCVYDARVDMVVPSYGGQLGDDHMGSPFPGV
jgi:hypothetical protein